MAIVTDEDLDAIADAPLERDELGMTTIARVVARASRSAMNRARIDPEAALSHLRGRVSGMLSSSFSSIDDWARIGAVEGACAGWSGYWYTPKDCPSGAHFAAFCHAWAYAYGIAWWVAHGTIKGGGR